MQNDGVAGAHRDGLAQKKRGTRHEARGTRHEARGRQHLERFHPDVVFPAEIFALEYPVTLLS